MSHFTHTVKHVFFDALILQISQPWPLGQNNGSWRLFILLLLLVVVVVVVLLVLGRQAKIPEIKGAEII